MVLSVRDNFRELPEGVNNSVPPKLVDIHCHCLPDIDDGPANSIDANLLAQALVNDHIHYAIATPHQLGRYDGFNQASVVRQAVKTRQTEIDQLGLKLKVVPGGDVRIDERLVAKLANDEILTLADHGKHLLLELPHGVYFEPWDLLQQLQTRGLQLILSHPERYPHFQQYPRTIDRWLERGIILQITAGSLIGDFGDIAQQTAWHFIFQGKTSLIATDAHHHLKRPPLLTTAYQHLTSKLGSTLAQQLCIENPTKILNGDLIAIPSLIPGVWGAR